MQLDRFFYALPESIAKPLVIIASFAIFILWLCSQALLFEWVAILTANSFHAMFSAHDQPSCTTAMWGAPEWTLVFFGLAVDVWAFRHYWVNIRPQAGHAVVEACEKLQEHGLGVGAPVKGKKGTLAAAMGRYVVTKVSAGLMPEIVWVTLHLVKMPTIVTKVRLADFLFEYQPDVENAEYQT